MKKAAVALIALTALLLPAAFLHAYQYTMCGSVPCAWPGFPVGFHISKSVTALFPDAAIPARDSILRWNSDKQTFCGIRFKFLGESSKNKSEADLVNLIFAQTSGWEYGPETLAVTQCYYRSNGHLADCDIALNGQDWQWSDSESGGKVLNLRDTITHEAGHMWGLDHSDVQSATMYAYYQAKMVAADLDEDDIRGAADRYCGGDMPEDDALEPNDSASIYQESGAEFDYKGLRLYDIDHFRLQVESGKFPKIEVADDEPARHKLVSIYDLTGNLLGESPCDGDCVAAPYQSPVDGYEVSVIIETDFSRSRISAETYDVRITQVAEVSPDELTDDEVPAGDDDETSGCGC